MENENENVHGRDTLRASFRDFTKEEIQWCLDASKQSYYYYDGYTDRAKLAEIKRDFEEHFKIKITKNIFAYAFNKISGKVKKYTATKNEYRKKIKRSTQNSEVVIKEKPKKGLVTRIERLEKILELMLKKQRELSKIIEGTE